MRWPCSPWGGFIAFLFRNALFGPGVIAGFDLVNYFYPLKTYAARRLAAGDIPLWNPDLFFGSPFLANIQNGVLYPPNLLFSWLSFPDALLANAVGHFWWGALGMYLLVRLGWGCSRFAALLAGGVFAGSGFLGAHVGHLNQVQAAVWLPWLLLALERAAGGSVGWLVLGGWLLALQLLAGHTQEVYYSLLTMGIWAAALVVLRRPNGRRVWGLPELALLRPPIIFLVVAALNAAGLAAAQLLPTIELSGLSHRAGGLTIHEATTLAVDRTHILESLLPTFWELPNQEVIGYVGVAALVVALAGLTHPLRLGRAVVLAGIAALAVTLALGLYTSLYLLLHDWLPAFDAFRAPGRWLFITTVALAGLTGLGADAVLRQWSGNGKTGHRSSSSVLVYAGARGRGRWAGALCLAVIGRRRYSLAAAWPGGRALEPGGADRRGPRAARPHRWPALVAPVAAGRPGGRGIGVRGAADGVPAQPAGRGLCLAAGGSAAACIACSGPCRRAATLVRRRRGSRARTAPAGAG